MATKNEEVFTNEAITKLKHHGIFTNYTEDFSCWVTTDIWFPMEFPQIKFHDSKIPSAYNQPFFLVYLGFRAPVAFNLFYKFASKSDITRAELMECVKIHIDSVCATSINNWVSADSLLANTVMEEVGLMDSIKAEVKQLYEAFQRSPLVFQRYFDENHDKNFENLKLVDFMQELVYQRMQKLMALNEAALRYLP